MKIYIFIIIVCSVGVFAGCGPGVSDFSEKMGNGYYYHRNSSIDRFIAPKTWNDKTPMIPSRVVLYKSNRRYITAKREIIQMSESGSRVGSGVFDYWILDTEVPSAHGPFSKDEFNTQFRQLALPDELNLK